VKKLKVAKRYRKLAWCNRSLDYSRRKDKEPCRNENKNLCKKIQQTTQQTGKEAGIRFPTQKIGKVLHVSVPPSNFSAYRKHFVIVAFTIASSIVICLGYLDLKLPSF